MGKGGLTMGMDHWIQYEYIDEEGDDETYYIVEWRKQYWINSVISNYIGDDNDGCHEITLKDIIALRNYFQLCIDNPKLVTIGKYNSQPLRSELIRSVKEINEFMDYFDIDRLTGKFYYIVSV